MSQFTSELNELVANIEGLSFNVASINSMFTTTTLFTPLLSAETPGKSKIDLDKRERIFHTASPVFIRRVEFFGEAYRNIEFRVYTSEGHIKTMAMEVNSKGGVVFVNEFCVKFSILSKGGAKPKLSSLCVFGFEFTKPQKMRLALSEFVTVNAQLNTFLMAAKKTVAELDAKYDDLVVEVDDYNQSIGELGVDLNELKSLTEKEKKALSSIEVSINTAKNNLFTINSAIEAKENNLQQLTREAKNLNDSVADLNQQLSGLVNDRSLISDEFSDFIKEGKGQATVYLWLMLVPAVVIGIGVLVIYNGASSFLSAHYETTGDVAAAFLLRIPFATVVGGAIYYSWKIAHAFMSKIFSIQEERLTLAKLLVLAKNTVFSTAEDLGVDPVEKFHVRTRLKIEMLKSHLANNLGAKINMPELELPAKPEPEPVPEPTPADEIYSRS